MALYTPNPNPPVGWTEAVGGLTAAQMDETLKNVPFHTSAFGARSNGTAATLGASSTWAKVPNAALVDVITDTHSGWNASTAIYTVPTGQAGVWLVSGLLTMSSMADQDKLIAAVYQNGALAMLLGRGGVSTSGATDTAGFGGSGLLSCAAGDTLELYGWSGSTDLDIAVATGYTHFEGFRLL